VRPLRYQCQPATIRKPPRRGNSRSWASYLEVLTNDTNLFNAELSLATARFNHPLGRAHRALGVGWE
jgi:hypothetical protein